MPSGDLQGASDAMTQQLNNNKLQNSEKQLQEQEQLNALDTFNKAMQKAGQI